MSENRIVKGKILKTMPNALYEVETMSGASIVAHVGEKMKMFNIRLIPGDLVTVELSQFNSNKGRITAKG